MSKQNDAAVYIEILRDMAREQDERGYAEDHRWSNVVLDALCVADWIDYEFNRGWVLTSAGRAAL